MLPCELVLRFSRTWKYVLFRLNFGSIEGLLVRGTLQKRHVAKAHFNNSPHPHYSLLEIKPFFLMYLVPLGVCLSASLDLYTAQSTYEEKRE